MTSNHPTNNCFVVDISTFSRQFLSDIQTGSNALLNNGFDQTVITQIFQESVRQIFSLLTPDFAEFSMEIQTAPDWQYMMRADEIMSIPELEQGLRGAIQRFGMGIWLTLNSMKFFTQPRVFVLQAVDLHTVCFIAYEDLQAVDLRTICSTAYEDNYASTI